ncbi:hypothetical protein AArcSl_1200 [Halalkaliarchaeum desulfuricum]|uniref:Uncharacterized protein n=1 Tax=Halalkaliarchaeum desulfuricum TaxID=2055893 RepID=A0A343TIB1_9EURY|nr:hypothetical protein [Halalkaliarchaeum desulfuricum]AUX08833.1 hypothetical protein AArcSl_1200 [Halalkaliarchaeum desulfuricum]
MSLIQGGMLLGLLTLLSAAPVLQAGILATPIGQLLVVLVGIAIVIVVGRIVLRIAWRLVTIAAVIVGIALVLSMFGLL